MNTLTLQVDTRVLRHVFGFRREMQMVTTIWIVIVGKILTDHHLWHLVWVFIGHIKHLVTEIVTRLHRQKRIIQWQVVLETLPRILRPRMRVEVE